MSNARFSVGQTVRLKSGGPRMVVESVSKTANGEIAVGATWFNSQQKNIEVTINKKFWYTMMVFENLPRALCDWHYAYPEFLSDCLWRQG